MNGQQPLGQIQHVKAIAIIIRGSLLIASLGFFATGISAFAETNDIRIVSVQGTLEIIRRGAVTGVKTADTNQPALQPFDRLRTGPDSRVTLLWSDHSPVTFGALTELEILPPHDEVSESGLHLIRGLLSFFHRDKPGRIRVIIHGSTAGINGTEFVIEATDADGAERATLSVVDGIVTFTNELAGLVLTNGQRAIAEPRRAPVRTAGFNATNLLQWCFYYPAVLDLNDVPFTSDEQKILGESLTEYRAGDLLAALDKFPKTRKLNSDAERVYLAALLLSVGQVEQAETNLAELSTAGVSEKIPRLAGALRTLVAAVKREQNPATIEPQLPTEFLAASYYEQSRAYRETSLTSALQLARQSVARSPDFGFGWERVAELEFSFGRTDRATEALNRSLVLAPRNTEALALKGFLLAAQNKTREAIEWFDRALAVDSALGNAWLGRGLCRIHLGDARGGRADLLLAAALEPQRATLRSYLGKAWSDAGDDQHARKEFGLAQKLDPNDPTSWLYSALNNEQHNRINDAIRDLEKSQELNENRSIYRSGLLLDQDRAVRSANLARIYQDAGLEEAGFQSAARAVNEDYGNYSAHLFLANSYEALSEQSASTFRFESATISEYLIGNILAPPNAGILAPVISQQEYGKFFDRDHVGISSTTEYLSRGAWFQSGAIYAVSDRQSIAFESDYAFDPGQRINNDVEQETFSLHLKQQITPQDSIYGLIFSSDTWAGDLAQRFDPASAVPDVRTDERQHPSVVLGYHHEWSPGVHTLALVGYLNDAFHFNGPVSMPVPEFDKFGNLYDAWSVSATTDYRAKLEILPFEMQQIWETPRQTTIVGARYQTGWFKISNTLSNFAPLIFFPAPEFDLPEIRLRFERASVYGYHQIKIGEHLRLLGGVAYDYLQLPENFLSPPVSGNVDRTSQVSPKAGFIWENEHGTSLRGAFTRSIEGASFDQSFELEPAQLAGFTQTYRGIIPDSVEGTTSGASVDSYGLAFEQKFKTGTYVNVSAHFLETDFVRVDGALSNLVITPVIGSEHERLHFRETGLTADINQLIGRDLAVGVQYRLTDADLRKNLVDFPANFNNFNNFDGRPHHSALLQQLLFHATLNHPSGLFGRFEALWTHQLNRGFEDSGFGATEPGDDFWQLDAFIGYRFAQRRAEIALGFLNLTDQDFRLEPLTLYSDLPRHRTLTARFSFNF